MFKLEKNYTPSIMATDIINMVIIRQALQKDYTAIKNLIKSDPKRLMQNLLPKFSDFFIAENSGEIVGCCALEVYSKRIAEIRSLVVKDEFRRKGIGRSLVRACIKKAKKLKVYEVLAITAAVKLFDKHGFKPFKQEKFALLKVLGR